MSDALAVVEHRRGNLRDVPFEFVTAGSDLVGDAGGDLRFAIIGGDADAFAGELSFTDVDAIHTVAEGDEFNHDVTVQAVKALAEELDLTCVLTGNTVSGLDYAPVVVGRLDCPLVTDAISLESDGGPIITREMYTSKIEPIAEVDVDRIAATVRPGEWDATEEPGEPAIGAFSFDLDEFHVCSRVTRFERVGNDDMDIADADILVSAGRDIEEKENIGLVQELADAFGATLLSSWPIVDNGWLPEGRQVGQFGKVITPKFHIAVGISGAVQHIAEMRGVENIVAINTDPDASIFDIVDYGIVGNLFDVVPELTRQLE